MFVDPALFSIFQQLYLYMTTGERLQADDHLPRTDKRRNLTTFEDDPNEPWLSSIKRRRKSIGSDCTVTLKHSDKPDNGERESEKRGAAPQPPQPEDKFDGSNEYLKLKSDLLSHDLEQSKMRLEMLKKQQPRFPGLQTSSKRHDLFKDDPSAEGGESSQHSTGGNMAASVQAALQALQAGQLSLNQLSVQLMALGSPWQNQLAALAMKQAAAAASGNSSGPLGASSAPMGVPPHLPPTFPPTELQVKPFCLRLCLNSVFAAYLRLYRQYSKPFNTNSRAFSSTFRTYCYYSSQQGQSSPI